MNLLVYRLSSMGDVALTAPVVREFLEQYPKARVTFVTSRFYFPLLAGLPRLTLVAADTRGAHRGIRGIFRLAKELKETVSYDFFLDLHHVTRSQLLGFFLGLKTFRLQKGRLQKRAAIRRKNKIKVNLPHTIERYREVFARAGFSLKGGAPQLNISTLKKSAVWEKYRTQKGKRIDIGVAPLSAHTLKVWPAHRVRDLLLMIDNETAARFFMMGAPSEREVLEQYRSGLTESHNMAGVFENGLGDELSMMKDLDLMITMDSANMHIASLLQVPCVSIWGPTHPVTGFGPPGEPSLVVGRADLSCRPCGVFAENPCYRKDHACMNELAAEEVWPQVRAFMKKTGLLSSK